MYLFDTDVLSQVIKPSPLPRLLARLAVLNPEQQYTSAITVGELVYGAYRSPRPEYFMRLLEEKVWPNVRVISFDRDAGEVYGRLREHLEEIGTPLADPDLRIAAVALTHGLTLVTGNIRHFTRVQGLKLENWLVS